MATLYADPVGTIALVRVNGSTSAGRYCVEDTPPLPLQAARFRAVSYGKKVVRPRRHATARTRKKRPAIVRRIAAPRYNLTRLNGPGELVCFWPQEEPYRLPSVASEMADAMAKTRDVDIDLIMQLMQPRRKTRRARGQSSQGEVVSAAPEPATWGMLILGFAAVGAMLRGQERRRRSAGGAPPR